MKEDTDYISSKIRRKGDTKGVRMDGWMNGRKEYRD
jgi:hypothetical protein